MVARRPSLAALILLALFPGALAAAGAGAETQIRIGIPGTGLEGRPFVPNSLVAVAHSEKFVEAEFKDEPDVKISYTLFRGAGPAVNESLAAGRLDFVALGDLPALVGKSRGLPTKLVLGVGVREPLYLVTLANSDIKSIADLKGRKVSQFRGTNLQIAMDRALEAHGLSEKDVRFVSLDQAAAISALLSGNVEAVFGAAEYLDLVRRGLVKVVYSTKSEANELGRSAAVLVTDAFEEAHPEATQKVVTALVKAARYTSDEANRDKVFEIWAKSGIPVSSFVVDHEGERLADRSTPLLDAYAIARLKSQAGRGKAYGLLKKDIDFDAWIETKYLDKALKDLGLEHFWPVHDAKGEKIADGEVEKSRDASN
ncbi:sulfonate transport system substrate-binding protein [Rhodoblastus acidophilus]|uniref:Sulfonate transport system substrate-binding protein n=1 Tax=Rhodoblastus acidophilus TaxID=1074 RepID=A0A212S9X7_RHOAC|nr:ABC transporter substrate-binding protein [Rhodoblastus acidophilus]PPQ36068.1 hypothetical protein CKO16_18985 [Rhodoblastus acidophilus]RAI18785.1 hypothetical protein CH337_13560 [Rhodoblastus acidophilus]SNB82138.1 sulfonate transport system substrate-binding protein [Rhodoblastus acidophilus]